MSTPALQTLAPLKPFLTGIAALPSDRLAQRLWDDQRLRWEAGEKTQVEDYLSLLPVQAHDAILVDLIYGEFLLRREAGETPTVREYQERFPNVAAEIARQLSLYQVFSQIETETPAAPNRPTPSTKDATGSDPWVTKTEGKAPATDWPTPQQGGLPGEIAGYKVIAQLGAGGQGVIYRAVHPTLGRDVVIKLALEKVSAKEATDALVQEGRVLAELDDPGLARVYDFFLFQERACLIMEFVRGRDLEQDASTARRDPLAAARLVAKLARAVAVAHRRGVIHRDIKPRNVLIDEAGAPRLIDFGLARLDDAWRRNRAEIGLSGTVSYMAPEQARAEAPSPRSDLFALGGVLYFLLTGQAPFHDQGFTAVLAKAQRGEWDRKLLDGQAIPGPLRAAVERAMAYDPAARFATAEEFAGALEALSRPREKHWTVAACAAIVVAALGVGAWQVYKLATQAEPPPQGSQPVAAKENFSEARLHSFSLQVRVGRGKNYVDLVDAVPVINNDEMQIQTVVPAGLHAALFARGSSGKLMQLALHAPANEERALHFPDDSQKAIKLAGPAGNEMVLLCARPARPVAPDELRDLLAICAGWPVLPEDSVLALGPAGAKALQKSRDFAGLTDRPDPEGEVMRGLEELRGRLRPHFEHFEAIVFSHKD